MFPKTFFFLLLSTVVFEMYCEVIDDGKCNGFQANFDVKKVIGRWNVIAIIPEKAFPENQTVSCYKVEFSETDVAGLRWLINSTLYKKSPLDLTKKISGLIIRQRYHARPQFDIWSKAVEATNGCFEQVLSLDGLSNKGFEEALTHNDRMQLHILDVKDGSKPILLQMLWGKLITVVIYGRNHDISLEQLDEIKKLLKKLRGPQKEFKPCNRLLSENVDFMKHD